MLSNVQLDNIIEGVYLDRINETSLPSNLYEDTFNQLNNIKVENEQKRLDMARNLSFFAAAKTFQFVNSLQGLKKDADGFRLSFDNFKEEAKELHGLMYGAWLEAEIEQVEVVQDSAVLWENNLVGGRKTSKVWLKYQTQQDNRVRDEHKALNHIVLPMTNPIWLSIMPPNGWNCRCFVVPITAGPEPLNDDISSVKIIQQDFRFNAYEQGIIFKETHPYFDVDNKFNSLKSNNFGLPVLNG